MATRYLAVLVGIGTSLAFCGVLGLVTFLDAAGDRGSNRDFGWPTVTDGGCIQATKTSVWHGDRSYERFILASDCVSPPPPPGLDEFPKPGEVYVSPALNDLRRVDTGVSTQVPKVDGLIGAEGLVHANELYLVAGANTSTSEMLQFEEFGSGNDYLANALRFDRTTLYVIGGLFTLLPAAYLTGVCIKVNARIRQRQLGLLAILGATPRLLRLVQIWEAALTVGVGALIGSAASIPVLARLTPNFLGWKAFAGDLQPAWYVPLIAFSLTTATAVLSSWVSTRFDRRKERSLEVVKSRKDWRFFLLGMGLIAGGLAGWWNGDEAWPLVLYGRIATFAGLIVIIPVSVTSLGYSLAQNPNQRLALAGMRLRRPSKALTRSLAGLASGLFLFSAGLSTVESLGRDPAAMQVQLDAEGDPVIELSNSNAATNELISDRNVLVESPNSDTGEWRYLSGSCAALIEVLGRDINCNASPFYIPIQPGEEAPIEGATEIEVDSFRSQRLIRTIIAVVEDPPDFSAGNNYLFTVPRSDAVDLYNQLVGSSPEVSARFSGTAAIGGASELEDILDLFRWGAAFAVISSLLATLLALTALLYDRRAGNHYLLVLGENIKDATIVVVFEVAVAATITTLLAMLASLVWALSYSINSDNEFVGVINLSAPFVAVLGPLLIGTAVITWLSLRKTRANAIPDRDGLAAQNDTFDLAGSS